MSIAYRFILLFIFLAKGACVQSNTAENMAYRDTFNIPIKVLLEKNCDLSQLSWQIKSPKGFKIVAIRGDHNKKFHTKLPQILIKSKDNKLIINARSGFDTLLIAPNDKLFSFNGRTYEGTIAIAISDGCAHFINQIDLESYVAAVGLSESFADWPDEANKAMCIAFRSYGICKILEQRETNKKSGTSLPYDIQNSNYHQVYNGYQNTDHFKKIAQSTQGLVLAHKNKPILAMFDICCGGVTPSHKVGFNFQEAPYLARTYPCKHCKNYKYYSWEYKYKIKEVENILKVDFPKLKNLKEIKIVKKDKTGTVFKVRIQDKYGYHYITGKRLKQLLKKFKSLSYTIERSGNYIVFKGRGHGHLMGLCQHGARQMDNNKWDYKKILRFFYPGANLMRLQKSA